MTDTPGEHTDPQDISLLLRDFLRTIKAICMYPANNSLPQSMQQSFTSRLLDMLDDQGRLKFSIDKGVILYQGEIVHRDKSKEDNLAAIFFDAGITEIEFNEASSAETVGMLLATLRNFLTSPDCVLELPTLLWEAGIDGFSFQTAEDIALTDYDASFRIQEYFSDDPSDSGRIQVTENYESIFVDDAGDLEEADPVPTDPDRTTPAAAIFEVHGQEADRLQANEAATAMGYDDLGGAAPLPHAKLILSDELKLSEEEEERMRGILTDDADFDMYESTAHLLIELLLQEKHLNGFHESAVICEKVLGEFIAKGQLAMAASVMRRLDDLAMAIRSHKKRWAERLHDITITAGSRDRLRALATACNEHEEISDDELRAYLEIFDWQALSGLADMLGELEHRHHRMALCNYLVDHGRGKEEIVSRGIYDKRWYVVRNSVMILGHLGDDRALVHLQHVVTHEDRRVRFELVKSLRNTTNPKALEILRPMVGDPDKEIQREALRTIISFKGSEAFQAVAELVYSEIFRKLNQSDQKILLANYSRSGKERAVPYLVELITKYNFGGSESLKFLRRAAFEALAANPSEKAKSALEALARNWRPDIRSRAQQALKSRESVSGDRS